MAGKGGNNTGHMPREYYLNRINQLCGMGNPRVRLLNKLTGPELRELIILLEYSQEIAVENYVRDRRLVR